MFLATQLVHRIEPFSFIPGSAWRIVHTCLFTPKAETSSHRMFFSFFTHFTLPTTNLSFSKRKRESLIFLCVQNRSGGAQGKNHHTRKLSLKWCTCVLWNTNGRSWSGQVSEINTEKIEAQTFLTAIPEESSGSRMISCCVCTFSN